MIELTSKQLRRAAEIKDQVDDLNKELNRLLGGMGNGGPKTPAKRRKVSAATRAKMRAAWAKRKAGKK
jgi:hypothetical protein